MPTLDETLAQFYPSALTGMQPADQSVFLPSEAPDPVGVAIQTLQRVGALPPSGAPPMAPMGEPAPQPAMADMAAPMAAPEPAAPAVPMGPPPTAQPGTLEDAYGPSFTTTKPPATVGEAGAQQQSALSDVGQSSYEAKQAAFDANRSMQARVAGVQEQRLAAMEELQAATVVQRKRNVAEANLETAGWIQQLQDQAAKEPNPSRWWENQSTLGKALWSLSLVFGAGYAAMTPGAKNAAMENVRSLMNADMDEQRKRLDKELSALKTKGELMKDRQARTMSDFRDDHTYGLTRIDALERAFMARATLPGDQDALAMKAEAKAAFAALKLPYVERYRQEKLAEKAAAEARRHDFAMQGARQRFDKAEREAGQLFTTGRDAKLHQYKLEESPVSVSASFQPGGAIPLGKDGIPVLSELQSGVGAEAAGLVLKGADGKPAHGHGSIRFRDYKDMVAAGDTVKLANTRYTATKELLDLLDGEGSMVEVMGLGIVNPAIQARVQELGRTIAKTHDKRVTDKDFSGGVEEGMGFDPNGNWLERGKFAWSVDEIKAKLRDDLNSMPVIVKETLRPLNDAAINGQGTEAVWDPHYLRGQKIRERNAAEIEDKARPDRPLKDVQDYVNRRAAEAKDPARQGLELPDIDRAPVERILDTARGRGPKTVAAEAAKVLEELKTKQGALTEAVGMGVDPWSGVKDVGAVQAELQRTNATITAVETIAKDAEKKAAKTVKDFEKWAQSMRNIGRDAGKDFVTDDFIRENAKKRGLTDAEEEVRKVIDSLKGKK